METNNSQKIDMFIMTKGKYFEGYDLPRIKEVLAGLTDEQWMAVEMTQYKDPMFILIVSLLGGQLGIDRFLIGDSGLGIGKLLTCGGFGIWAIVDWFLIMGATREKNKIKFLEAIGRYQQ